jgi:ornithine cyclodeaminase
MSADALWLSEADVVDTLDLSAAVDAIAAGFRAEAAGTAATMVKTHVAWSGGQLHAIGGTMDDVVGTKTWAHTAGGAQPLLLLFAKEDGRLVAVLEAFALGQLRTAAVSAVLTDHLAAADVETMAMCGTGRQALPQVAAVAAVRPVQRVQVWSPDPERRAAFAKRVEAELEIGAADCASASAASDGAAVITVATRSSVPFLASADVAAGTHVNAVGAITPERAELAPDLVARCAVVVDNVAQARELSAELRQAYGDDDAAWSGVRALADVVAADADRPPGVDVTLGKAMGIGLADVAMGLACWRAAVAAGRGQPLRDRQRVAPRLKVAARARLKEAT